MDWKHSSEKDCLWIKRFLDEFIVNNIYVYNTNEASGKKVKTVDSYKTWEDFEQEISKYNLVWDSKVVVVCEDEILCMDKFPSSSKWRAVPKKPCSHMSVFSNSIDFYQYYKDKVDCLINKETK